jgi:hypothetical protein
MMGHQLQWHFSNTDGIPELAMFANFNWNLLHLIESASNEIAEFDAITRPWTRGI